MPLSDTLFAIFHFRGATLIFDAYVTSVTSALLMSPFSDAADTRGALQEARRGSRDAAIVLRLYFAPPRR